MDWERLFKPRYWSQNYPTDLNWDAALNAALDKHVVELGNYTVDVGQFRVWIENWPYAYGYLYGDKKGLPKVSTRKRLRKAVGDAKRNGYISKLEAYKPDVV